MLLWSAAFLAALLLAVLAVRTPNIFPFDLIEHCFPDERPLSER